MRCAIDREVVAFAGRHVLRARVERKDDRVALGCRSPNGRTSRWMPRVSREQIGEAARDAGGFGVVRVDDQRGAVAQTERAGLAVRRARVAGSARARSDRRDGMRRLHCVGCDGRRHDAMRCRSSRMRHSSSNIAQLVIPAKAGTMSLRRDRTSKWIPAFAGMTISGTMPRVQKTAGPDNTSGPVNPSRAEGDGQNSKCSEAM